MALPMVHLYIADKMIYHHNLHIQNLSDFYLGSIAADAVHLREGFIPEDKIKSHLNARNPEFIDNIMKFLDNSLPSIHNDYILGYAVHVLTDIYWLNYIYMPFRAKYYLDKEPVADIREAYYIDTDQLDFILFDSPERIRLWECLKQSKGITLPGCVSSSEVDLWLQRTLTWFDNKMNFLNQIRYITIEEIYNFISIAADLCTDYLTPFIGKHELV